jgi:hypothetical protein
LLLDHGRVPPLQRLDELLTFARAREYLILEAQLCRGLGIGRSDRALLTHSLELLVGVGATPYSARVRCDRALLTGDHAELEAGLRVLEHLGDTDQRERYQRRAVG